MRRTRAGQEVSPCLLCGSVDAVSVLSKASETAHFEHVEVLRCTACDHRYLAHWADTLSLPLYTYYAERVDWPREQLLDPLNQERYAGLVERFEGKSSGRRLLDVGCGMGHLVKVARERGWDARGIDTSHAAVRLGERLGTGVEELDFFSPSLDDNRFDVIVMTELLEHVPKPLDFLRRSRDLLSAGGLFYLTTPNFNSLTRRIAGAAWAPIHPEHISYFVGSTLARAMRDVGFTVARVGSRNTSPAQILGSLRRSSPNADRSAPTASRVNAGSADATQLDATQRLRRTIRSSKALTKLLDLTNTALDLTHTGDTLVAWATR